MRRDPTAGFYSVARYGLTTKRGEVAPMKTRQRTLDGQQAERDEPQTALSKRERDGTPEAQDSWADAVAAKRQASEAETQPTQPPDEARAPASPPPHES